jgi:hypothetical protein
VYFNQNKSTTPNSSTIIPLLTSVIQQISIVYDQPTDDIPDELSSLIGHFKKVLTFATDEKPIIIVFDSNFHQVVTLGRSFLLPRP